MAKLVRVLTYEGTEAFIEASLAKIGVPLNGSYKTTRGTISSVVVEARACPCLTCSTGLTSNHDLVCNNCKAVTDSAVTKSQNATILIPEEN